MTPACFDEGTLKAYSDNALSPIDKARVDEHLQSCALCKLTLSEQQSASKQVQSLLSTYLQANVPDAKAALTNTISRSPVSRPMRNSAQSAPLSSRQIPSRISPARPRRTLPAMLAMGLGLAATLVVAFWLIGFLRQSGGALADLSKGEFVPQGKVRHLVYTHSYDYSSATGGIAPTTNEQEDVWLADGKDHLLMYRTLSGHPDAWLLVNDNGAYIYSTQGQWAIQWEKGYGISTDPVIARTPYDRRYLAWYLPGSNDVTSFFRNTSAPVNGENVNGRDTLVFEMLDNMTADSKVLPYGRTATSVNLRQPFQFLGASTQPWGSVVGYNLEGTPQPHPSETPDVTTNYSVNRIWSTRMDYKIWVDKATNQVLQQQFVQRSTGDGEQGNVMTSTITLSEAELLDEQAVPAGLFTLNVPRNATQIDASAVFVPDFLPADQYVEAPEQSGVQTGWYQTTWDEGGFSYLKSRNNDGDQNSGGWYRQGSVEDGLEYIAGYKDAAEAIAPDKLDAWLDTQLPIFAATMRGTISKSTSIAPKDGLVGRDLTIQRDDGRITLARVYALGRRLYFLYVTGAYLTSFDGSFTDEYLNSFTISHPADTPAAVGKAAPDFTLFNIRTGKSVQLSFELTLGKPIVLTFSYAGSCIPCDPAVTELLQNYPQTKDSVVYLSVFSNISLTEENVAAFSAQTRDIPWLLLAQDAGAPATPQLEQDYNLTRFPAIYFIDKNGIIRDSSFGDDISSVTFEQGLAKIR